jgi:hypothetical protein
MGLNFRPSSLAPPGLIVDDLPVEPNRFVDKAHGSTGVLPMFGVPMPIDAGS